MKSKESQKISPPNKLEPHFTFYRSEIIIVSLATLYYVYAGLKLLYSLVNRYPVPQQQLTQSYLSPILGHKRNNHDLQWEDFRNNLPILIPLIFGWYIANKISNKKINTQKNNIILGMVMLIYAYRADFLFYCGILISWYYLTIKFKRSRYVLWFAWGTCIIFLYLNQVYDHFRGLSEFVQWYVPIDFLKNRGAPILWTNLMNMSFLKLLSFTIDQHRGDEKRQLQKHKQKCLNKQQCYQCRDLSPLPSENILNFFQYMYFPPTLFTGPPIAYKNFHSFKFRPTKKQPQILRWLGGLICIQLWQHFFHAVKPHQSQTLIEIDICGLAYLIFIWLKFLLIWRTARLWSLMMGIDVIDNMGRCVLNNYGFQRFWRMWHKGFNHWLIRYLYIPCGGNRNYYSIIAVIAFVAFWHDHTIKIVLWAFILVLFLVPEILIKSYFKKNYSHLYPKVWFKYVCALACGLYIQIICLCNLIGFGFKLTDTQVFISALPNYIVQLIIVQVIISSGVILMFYIRQIDGRKD